jgi:small subunit ribosomal protein S4
MIRKKKLFSRPRKAFEKSRIDEENKLSERYGLKNKKEIWKTQAKVDYFRTRAKALAKFSHEEQKVLFDNLKAMGLRIESIADVLALKVEDLLERRLPTVLFKMKLADTARQARQMVVHKRVSIDGKIINIPSYLVQVSEEKSIKIIPSSKKPKVEKKEEEVKEESNSDDAETAEETNNG